MKVGKENNRDNLGGQLLVECGLTRPQVEARPGWAAKKKVVFTVV